MIHIDITTQGADVIRRWLEKGVDLDRAIGQGLGQWATETLDGRLYGMGNYAPQPPGSTYVRTGNLGANWGLDRPRVTSVRFYNMTAYAVPVLGDGNGKGQARRMGHWWLARQRVEEQLPGALEKISDAINRQMG